MKKTHWEYLADQVHNLAGVPILDLGSGKGAFLLQAAERGATVTGLEISEKYIRMAKERLSSAGYHVRIEHGAGEHLPFRDAEFGFINMCEVIEHVEDPDRLLSEAYRVLQSGGHAYLSVPNRFGFRDQHFHLYLVNWFPRALSDLFIIMFGKHKDYADTGIGRQSLTDMHYFTFGTIVQRAREVGFEVQDMRVTRITRELHGIKRYLALMGYRILRAFYFDSFHLLLTKPTNGSRSQTIDNVTTGASKPIKVALVINGFLIGGAQNVLLQIIKRIDRTRFTPVLITLMRKHSDEKQYLFDQLPAGTQIYDLRFKGFFDMRAWRMLWRALRESNPDVVFSNLFFSNTVMRFLKPLFGYRVIIAEHNTYVDKTLLQKVADWCLSWVTYRIVAVSKTVARFTAKQEHISPSKFFINHGGIDIRAMQKEMDESDPLETWKRTGFTPPNKIILSVARVVPQKNQRLTLEGFALFAPSHPEYRLLVIGGGNLVHELEAYAKELGIGEKVRFLGYQKQMYPFFKISHFFVSTSLVEGFGTTHVEALVAGLPLVSTKTAGPDEIIKEGVNGFFIPEYTKEAVAESLAKMAALDLERMREAVRKSAEPFAIECMIEKYENLFADAGAGV